MRKNIISCNVGSPEGPPPITLRELGVERIIGRKIIRWSPDIGTYGMGGCGFLGTFLSKTENYPEEWLILKLWGATNWLLLNNANIGSEAVELQIKRQQLMRHTLFFRIYFKFLLFINWFRSLRNWPGLGEWDKCSSKIVGATIIDAHITDNATCILLQKGNKKLTMEITVPPQWEWNDEESHLDAWAISDNMTIWH